MSSEEQFTQPLTEPRQTPDQEMLQLMRENAKLTREIYEISKKTNRYILFSQIFTVVKVILIVGPIVISIIYLPPLLKEAFGTYQELLGGGTGQTLLEGGNFVNDLFGSGH